MSWITYFTVIIILVFFSFIVCLFKKRHITNENVYEQSLITFRKEKEERFNKFKEKFVEEEECCICMDNINEKVYDLPCSHVFHKTCLRLWADKNYDCPNCRQNILE